MRLGSNHPIQATDTGKNKTVTYPFNYRKANEETKSAFASSSKLYSIFDCTE